MKSIVGKEITSLLQTQSKSVGVTLEEFGEAHWITLVAKLNDGSAIQINEYDCEQYSGNLDDLIEAELIQDGYQLEFILNKKIIGLTDKENEFAIALENDLCFHCAGAPGGNYPWVWNDIED